MQNETRPRMKFRRIPLLVRIRLSCSTAVLSIAVVASMELEKREPLLMDRRLEILEAALGLGLLLWIIGCFNRPASDDEERPFRYLANLRYWGVMSVLLGLVFFNMTHERPAPVVAPKARIQIEAPPRPARPFPPLVLQGISVRNGVALALINRRLLEVGDTLDEVRVAVIGRNSVTVTFDGQTNVLRIYSRPSAMTQPGGLNSAVAGR
jgi:hypothetical protein